MLSFQRNESFSCPHLQKSKFKTMDAHLLHDFRRQASFFFKEKIKAVRLALTDTTPAQLLTEEATHGDSSVPDSRSMRLISRAAFEVDDYWRIVDILHKRLREYDRQNWRASYKALILLEHLLTHGPARVAEEFECDKEIISEMENFHYVDEKGFGWGLTVRRKAERVVKLIEDASFLREERATARKITREIKGFGSFCNRPITTDTSFKDAAASGNYQYQRSNSHFSDYQSKNIDAVVVPKAIYGQHKNIASEGPALGNEYPIEEDHPFCEKDNQALTSLLSTDLSRG